MNVKEIDKGRFKDSTIYWKPAPQGSKRHVGGGVMVESSNRLKPWRKLVSELLWAEHGRFKGDPTVPMFVRLTFVFKKPKSAPKKRTRPTVYPDLDKLVRAILDSGKGVLWHDDAQVCRIDAAKAYGDVEKVVIQVRTMEPAP